MLSFESLFKESKGVDYARMFIVIDRNGSGYVNQDKMHSYLMRLPGVFSSRDAEAIVDRIQKDKTSIQGFNFCNFRKLFTSYYNIKTK